MKIPINPHKILIVRLSSLGDIVILTPLIRSLRQKYPGAEIDFLIKQEFQAVVLYNPFLNKVITYDTKTGFSGFVNLARQLAARNYDLILDMHTNLRSRLLQVIRRRPLLRYKKPRLARFLLFYCWLDLFAPDFNLLSAYYQVVAPLGIKPAPHLSPEIFLPEEVAKVAQNILIRHRILSDYVVILPIATWPNKLYPLAKYRAVANQIKQELGLEVVWLGGRLDAQLQRLKQKPAAGAVIAGETTLLEALAILKNARAVIGNDTGLTYAAEALGVPIVLILGPTARQTGAGAYRSESIVLERQLWCRPCSQKGDRSCYRTRRHCLELIEVSEVFEALEKILGVKK
jgi:ADP-heptose:LPS heptosyltransferase